MTQIVLVAVASDDPDRLKDFQPALKNDDLVDMRFENDMNVLNLSLELRQLKMVQYLACILTKS